MGAVMARGYLAAAAGPAGRATWHSVVTYGLRHDYDVRTASAAAKLPAPLNQLLHLTGAPFRIRASLPLQRPRQVSLVVRK